MLAPVAEVEFGGAGRRMLELAMALRRALWPEFAAELARGVRDAEIALRPTGTLLLARDADEEAELERQLEFRRSLGLDVRRLRPSAARELEPALAPALRGALEAPGDHSLDPRPVLARAARGVRRRRRADPRAHAARRPRARRQPPARPWSSPDGERLSAGAVVLAAGPWSGRLPGLPDGADVPVRPVKGQILRLRDPAGPGLLERVIRYEGGYVVPRGDGRYVLGGTVEEKRVRHEPDRRRGLRAAARGARAAARRDRDGDRRALGRDAARHAGQPPGDRPRAARRPVVGDAGTTATGSCSRR